MILARLPLARIVRRPRAWLPIAGWVALALAVALVLRAPNGADRAMRGTVGSVVFPLLSYAIVSAALGGLGLRSAIRGLVALGADARRAALAAIAVAAGLSAAACGALAAVVVVLAHGPADAPLASDVPVSCAIAAVGGAVYAAYFCAGSAIGKGAFRGGFLVLDWVLGSMKGAGALLVPRGPLVSLLGGAAPLELSRRTLSVVLFLLGAFYFALALRLVRRHTHA